MRRSYRRRLIAGKVPNRFSLTNFNFFLFLFLIFGATLFGPLVIGLELDVFPYFLSPEEVATQYLLFQKLVWPPLVLLFVMLCVGTVIFTHRIAGPLYRLRCVLKTIAEGNLTVRAVIRRHDYLHDEADCVNDMIDSLRTKLADIAAQHQAAQDELLELKKAAGNGSDVAEGIQRLEGAMERVSSGLRLFKTTS